MDRKRSEIWTHFNVIDNSKAACRLCKVKISHKSGSTNNLHRHIRKVHPSVQLREKRQAREPDVNEGASVSATVAAAPMSQQLPRSTTQRSMSHFIQTPIKPVKQTTIDEELGKMITSDFQPFSIVDDKGFRRYTHALNPMYAIPSRKTLSQRIIPGLYDRERAALQERVQKAIAVCLTTDCWTSRTTTSYMSVTCHFVENFKLVTCLLDCFEFSERHTSENLAEELLKVAKEWNVENKVVCCVSDNAANITKAIKSLKWTHHPCLAHTLNLVVRDALKVMKPTVDKVKGIVEFFHRSTTATQKLKSTQQQMGMPELKLKQECITRWNSTFHMLKRILESKDAVISTLAVINAPIDPLSQEEWEILQEACTVLEAFEQVTVEISADSYVTASKVLILCKGLQKVTAEHQTSVTTGKVKELVDALCASMDRKFHRMEWNTVLSETTILDPRFKKLAFTDNRAVDEALQRITAAAARASQTTPLPGCEEGEDGAEQQQEEPQASAVWRFFEERVTGSTTRQNPSSDAILEVRSYLEEPLFQRSADPLSWWEAKDSLYPRLTHVMTRRLCVVATSVPSERIFSKTGQMLTERRNRINPSKLRHLVFLNANLH
ncbi:E3 SUMO-protein ligase ZBED1-like [Hippocampus zosterae]|uniref:E3 SUMO-protein ligase ZBED1-like n=1 Tax=Hippocampus zosterae TaxID=109293 RepID=UPI00223E4556|nr:E3 SUMO-protein ligase ZBED1-like [Hippocampus zosterae]